MKTHVLDTLPRPWLGQLYRPSPMFRSCGVTGFYVALIATFAAGLLAGHSLLVLAACAAVCGASFFVYALARKWVVGREELVLFEMVWFAEILSALFLHWIGEPLPGNLDAIAVGMCFFLAGGRVGCFMVGCCHGKPSAFGVMYGERHDGSGFERALLGVRLFPLQLVEAAGLVLIGLSGLAVIRFAAPGVVFVWFLAAYAIMRFGLEGLRGDVRPHLFGLSQSRWMALAELCVAIALYDGPARARQPSAAIMVAMLAGALFAAAIAWAVNGRRRMLAPRHVRELRSLVRESLASDEERIELEATSRGVGFAASHTGGGRAHVSLSLPGAADDLELLSALSGRAFPELLSADAQYRPSHVLHFDVPVQLPEKYEGKKTRADRLLFGRAVRRLQAPAHEEEKEPPNTASTTSDAPGNVDHRHPSPPERTPPALEQRRPHYFERGS